MNRRFVALLLPLLLVPAACTTADPEPVASGRAPFADCATLTTAPTPSTGPAPTAPPPSAALPELVLPCFTGGTSIAVDELRGPAVINLWASWCAPCRKELPAFQRLAQRSAGQLHVIGVNSRDSREAARSVGEDFGLTFPNLADPQEQLSRKLARNALPLTLLVDAQGRIRHLDSSGALDDAALTELVRQHLNVVVQ